MLRTALRSILLFVFALCACASVFASTTASITVNGAEQPGDSNHITISFNGFIESVNYGPYSTPASIASAFAVEFSTDYLSVGLCAKATGSTINFKLKNGVFDALNVTGSTNSFQLTSSGFFSQGSQIADSGTVTLTVNGNLAASTNYGSGATPASIAQGLAANVTGGSFVNVTASGDDLILVSKQAGAGTNYGYSVQNTSYDSTDFLQASFPDQTIQGSLSGGANAGSDSQQIVYSYSASYDGVGNVISINDSVMGNWSMTGGYDTLNRLAGVTATSGPFAGQYGCWTYDAFGNRLIESMSTTSCSNNPPLRSWARYTIDGTPNTADNGKNQVKGSPNGTYQYDAAGNALTDGLNQYLYDAEDRICAVASEQVPGMEVYTGYIYDADGTRVAKGSIAAWSCDPSVNGFQSTSEYVLGPSGEQATEMGAGSNGGVMTWLHTNVFAEGKLIATYEAAPSGSSVLHFYLDDPLGTRRVQTDYAGVVEQTCQSLPFGDGETCGPTPTEHLFTGKERDTESGNDYFGARYYASSMGRWLSPDPSQLVFTNLRNPQALNLYAYVMNNPLIHIDPNGWDCVYFNNSGNGVETVDHNSNSGECGSNGGDWVNGYTQSNWAVYNGSNDSWNISSLDSANVYYTNAAAPGGQQPNGNAPCSGNCDLGYASVTRGWLFGQMIAGNSMDFMQWLSAAGVKNSGYNGSQYPLSTFWKYFLGGPDGSNNYAGPGGGGQPQGPNDWAAAMHDYNYFKIGGIGKGYSFFSNPGDSALTTPMLRQADAILGAHVSGTEGLAINAAVSSGALVTKALSVFH